MKFRKLVNEKNRVRTPAKTGDKIVQPMGWIYKDGEYQYLPKGNPHNHYEETQAARDSVDLKKILERYRAGDESALDRVNGLYLDLVDLPRTVGEVYDAISKQNEIFDSMPIEIKEKYGHNPAAFWKAYGSETFDNFINDYRKAFILDDDLDPINTQSEVHEEMTQEVTTSESEHE